MHAITSSTLRACHAYTLKGGCRGYVGTWDSAAACCVAIYSSACSLLLVVAILSMLSLVEVAVSTQQASMYATIAAGRMICIHVVADAIWAIQTVLLGLWNTPCAAPSAIASITPSRPQANIGDIPSCIVSIGYMPTTACSEWPHYDPWAQPGGRESPRIAVLQRSP